MKIWYSPYELFPLQKLNRTAASRREGFLLKIQTADFKAGYADCHPWKIFGDDSVKGLLKRLREGRLTPLLVRSLYFASVDGLAREKKISLFDRRLKMRSHYTCTDVNSLTPAKLETIGEAGYTTIKIKLGKNPKQEAHACNRLFKKKDFRWRLDFNGTGAAVFLASADKDFLSSVDLIEDPLPFAARTWQALGKKYHVTPAFDHPPRSSSRIRFRGPRIIKPARQSLTPRKIDIITNSMDHPVGQSFAAWEAQQNVKKWGGQYRDFGLKTAHLFRSNEFFREIADPSPFFKFSAGHGIGFDDLLRRQKWLSL